MCEVFYGQTEVPRGGDGSYIRPSALPSSLHSVTLMGRMECWSQALKNRQELDKLLPQRCGL